MPALTQPLMPQLGVNDAARSIAFYRDVLGFTVNFVHKEDGVPRVAEFQWGSARLQVGEHDGVADNEEQRRARGATILFFQTDDVAALHEQFLQRGADPSEIEEVDYWIRMRVFDVRDPDGHALWFGQPLEPTPPTS